MTIDGPLKSVYVVNDDDLKVNGGRWLLMGGGAIKVRGYTTDTIADRRVIGGDALPVYVLGENDIKQRGGNFRLKGGQPIKITDVIGSVRGVKQGAAVAVYPVLDDGVTYDEDFLGVAWSPADITLLRLWLDAQAIPAQADNTDLTTWADQSGNSYDVTQAVAGKKPHYQVNGVGAGLPSVRFDGVDDILVNATANWLSTDTAGTVVIVYQLSNPPDASQGIITSWDEGAVATDLILLSINLMERFGLYILMVESQK
jgi:hypothetical protein